MIHYNNLSVRRQDRLLKEERAKELLCKGDFGILSMYEQREELPAGYGIPINYVWDRKDKIYFHCAPEGHKLLCIDKYPLVSFCIVGHTQVISHQFTTAYESVVLRGKILRNLSSEERKQALKLFLEKYCPSDQEVGAKYIEKSFHRTEILCMEIKTFSGKTKQIPS